VSKFHDVQTFIELSRHVQTPAALHDLMQAVSREMGFDHFALVHHVDLRPQGTLVSHVVTEDFIALSDYPQAWMDQYINDDIVSDDPVLLAAQRTGAGFGWDRLGDYIQITPAHRQLIEKTRKAGICDGFTVPANIPGELNGSCNFAVGPRHDAPRDNYAMAHVVGSFAFEAARTLVARMRNVADQKPVKLAHRELECIALVARGKSDWEIGRILGLSEGTVATYVKRARERYGVSSRIQVVLRAAYDGTIPFSELF